MTRNMVMVKARNTAAAAAQDRRRWSAAATAGIAQLSIPRDTTGMPTHKRVAATPLPAEAVAGSRPKGP